MTEPGYKLNREGGLTENERAVGRLMVDKMSQSEIARELGLTRQRVSQLVKSLEEKGVLLKMDGQTFVDLQALELLTLE